MSPTRKRKSRKPVRKEVVAKKPLLIQCGKHFINPNDVARITQIRKDLFVVKFISEPDPEWACWVDAKDIGNLLSHFEIIEASNE